MIMMWGGFCFFMGYCVPIYEDMLLMWLVWSFINGVIGFNLVVLIF